MVESERGAAVSGGVACLVLAAGAGRRFGAGGPKQLAPLAGRPLVEHALAAAATSSADRVVVVLGAEAGAILARVDLQGAKPITCAGWEEGMAAALRAGIAAAGGYGAAVVVLGDQPLVTAAAIDRVIGARASGYDAARATYGGVPGHPVLLERRLFAAIGELRGDTGARPLLAARRVAAVPCDDVGDPLDVDAPADLDLAAQALAP